jgi:hypothetical protein
VRLTNDPDYKLIKVTKAKWIGGHGELALSEDPTAPVFTSTYKQSTHTRSYQTRSIPAQFHATTLDEFNRDHVNQLRLAQETLTLLDNLHMPYTKQAREQTLQQYRDFFFIDDLAFPVKDILHYLSPKPAKLELDTQTANSTFKPTDPPPEAQQRIKDKLTINSQRILDDYYSPKQAYNSSLSAEDQIIEVNIPELIKTCNFTFHPVIRGTEYYIKWQEDVIYDTNRFIIVKGSRQMGKSHVMSLRWILSSFKWYRRNILVCAYQQDTTGIIFTYMEHMLENFPEGSFTINRNKQIITNNMTQSRIIFRSLSEWGQRIRGMTNHEIIMDECFLVSDEIFEQILMPTLSTTGWPICMISTPGPINWFYWQCQKALQWEEGYSYYECLLDDNPFIVPEEKKRLYANKEDPIIQQEYFGKFSSSANSVFRPNKTSDTDFVRDYYDQSYFVFAYDPARKGKDRAGYILYLVANGQIYSLRSWFIPQQYKVTWDLQKKYIQEQILKDIPPERYYFVMDCTGVGDGVVAIMQETFKVHTVLNYTSGASQSLDTSYPYAPAQSFNVGKSRLINTTQDFMDQKVVQFYEPTNKDLFLEYDAIYETRNNLNQIGMNTKWFDDITNASMMWLWFIREMDLLSKTPPWLKEKKDRYNLIDTAYEKTPEQIRKAKQGKISHSHW